MIYPDETQTAEEVASHYNDLDQYYRQIWGEHVHHGYWRGNALLSVHLRDVIFQKETFLSSNSKTVSLLLVI